MADSLPLCRQLAERLGGKLARTRPVFDRGLLPFKLVIGQSGAVVKPRLLFSFGVSGAVNHVTGIGDAETVVAVNKDPDAAIFHYCDYILIAMSIGRMILRLIRCQTCRLAAKSIDFSIVFAIR